LLALLIIVLICLKLSLFEMSRRRELAKSELEETADTPVSHLRGGHVRATRSNLACVPELKRSVGYRGTISTNFEETSVILTSDYTPNCSGDCHALLPLDVFSCKFSSDLIDVIVRNTNRKAVLMQADHRRNYGIFHALTSCWSVLGKKGNYHRAVEYRKTGISTTATMARNRFTEIWRYLRFDHTLTREERKKTGKAAAVREVFEIFPHVPHGEVYVDEHLMSFRGHCPCRIGMKSKPDRYGVNMWMLCDVRTGYIWCVQIYTSKIGQKPEREQGKRVVLDLASDLSPGYGITTDDFFTSLDLRMPMLPTKNTLLGTIRPRRKKVPKEL
ncbi:PiggyBac transposable element-derived protein 4, partial [Trichinella papuae]